MMKTIISIVGLVAAGGIFFGYTKPSYDTAQTTNTKIVQYDAALQKATELQQRKQDLLKRYNTFNPTDIDRLQKLLPDHVDNVRLILDLDNLASKHSLAVQNVVVSASQVDSQQTAAASIGDAKQHYGTLTMKFTTQGTYATFQQFMADLETSLRIVDLVNLKISDGGSAQTSSEPIYSYDITIRTYWLK